MQTETPAGRILGKRMAKRRRRMQEIARDRSYLPDEEIQTLCCFHRGCVSGQKRKSKPLAYFTEEFWMRRI